jgi:hypothetical protein
MATQKERDEAAQARKAELADRTRRWISALEVERQGYVMRGLDERVAAVDTELERARAALTEHEPAPAQPKPPQGEAEPQKGRRPAREVLPAEPREKRD